MPEIPRCAGYLWAHGWFKLDGGNRLCKGAWTGIFGLVCGLYTTVSQDGPDGSAGKMSVRF